MSRNQKIDKINAYKKMLETKRLPNIKTEEKPQPENPEDPSTWAVEKQIHAEFQQWAERQLAVLLGEEGAAKVESGEFTPDEYDVLKEFAQKMLSKASNQASQAPQAPRPPAPSQNGTGSNEGYRSPREVKPLGNRRMERDAQKSQSFDKNTSKFLNDLDKMDREGPEY